LLQDGRGCPRPDVEFAESQLAVFFAVGGIAAVVESGFMAISFGSLPHEIQESLARQSRAFRSSLGTPDRRLDREVTGISTCEHLHRCAR